MNELSLMFGVVLMFLLRIGLPILVLIVLGVLIDRWQSQRDEYVRQHYEPETERKPLNKS